MGKIINRVRKSKYIEYILLTIILVLGFAVRLYKIDNPIADWHSWRQADTASVTRTFVERGINLLYPRYHDISSIQSRLPNPEGYRFVEFPLYNAIHALLAKNIPYFSLEVWGRLTSIIFATFSTFFVYLIGKRYMGSYGGLLSAFFFAFIPYNIYFTRVILPEPLATMLGLLGLYAFIKFTDSEKNAYLYLSGISFSLAMLVKPFVVFYLVPAGYLAYTKYGGLKGIIGSSKILTQFIIFTSLILVPFLAWRGWIGRHPEGIPEFAWAFNGDRIRFRPSFWRWIFGERLGVLILGVWGLIPFTFGVLKPKKENYFNLWFLLGMFLYVLVFATANVKHDYYQTFVIPAISLILAWGSLVLWKAQGLNKSLSRILLIFSIVMMFFVGGLKIKENFVVNNWVIMEAGKAIDEITPKDALVIAPYNGDTAFLYQTKRWGWPAVDDSFDNIIAKGADYYVSVYLQDSDTKLMVSRFETIKKTDNYIIVDLHKEIRNK